MGWYRESQLKAFREGGRTVYDTISGHGSGSGRPPRPVQEITAPPGRRSCWRVRALSRRGGANRVPKIVAVGGKAKGVQRMTQYERAHVGIRDAVRSVLSSVDGPCTIGFLSFQLPDYVFEDIEPTLLEMARAGEVSIGPEGVALVPQTPFSQAPALQTLAPQTSAPLDGNAEPSFPERASPDNPKGSRPDNPFLGMSDQSIEEVFARLFSESEQAGHVKPDVHQTDCLLGNPGAEALLDEEPPDDGDRGGEGAPRVVLTYDEQLPVGQFPKRMGAYIEKRGIRTWGQLLDENLGAVRGAGEKAPTWLDNHLLPFARREAYVPRWALEHAKVLNANAFFFNQMGVLCVAPRQALYAAGCEFALWHGEDAKELPVSVLALCEPTERLLKAHGIRTVGDIIARGEEGLLRIRSFGAMKLNEVGRALDALLTVAEFTEAGREAPGELEGVCGRETRGDTHAALAAQAASFIDGLESMEIPFYPPAMTAWLEADEMVIHGEGQMSQARVMSVLSDNGLLDDAVAACVGHLRSWKLEMESGSSEGSRETLRYPDNPIWLTAIESAFRDSECFSVDQERYEVAYRPPSIDTWLERNTQDPDDDRDLRMLRAKLEGRTLDEVGREFGVTRERARQIINEMLRRAPRLDEDRLRPLVSDYQIDREEFCTITGCSPRAFNYLALSRARKVKRRGLSEALYDERLTAGLQESVRAYLHERQRARMVEDNGELILKDRVSLVRHVLSGMERTATGPIGVDELYQEYRMFLVDHGLVRGSGGKTSLLPDSQRGLLAWMQRQGCFMAPRAASVRVYDFDLYDFTDLEEVWDAWSGKNIECSTALVFRENVDLMDALDIRDEYELYWASVFRWGETLDGVIFGPRMPMVLLGSANRHQQILSLIEELSPVSTADLAREYERRYGVTAASFTASFLGEFAQFKVGNGYEISKVRLAARELSFLHDELSGARFRSLAFVRNRFAGQFPDVSISAVSDGALRELAHRYPEDRYVISEGLIVQRDLDLPRMFHDMIYRRAVLSEGDDDLGHDVFRHSAFVSELNKALRAFDFIECQENVFYSMDELEKKFGVSRDNVNAYLDAVISFVKDDVPFTIRSLRTQGFSHVVELLGEDERFGDTPLEGILSSGSGSRRLSTSSMCEKMIFCKTSKSFTTVSLLEWIVRTEGELEIEELVDILESEYGIPAFPSYVRQVALRSSLVYKQSLDMVFESDDAYRAYVARYLE